MNIQELQIVSEKLQYGGTWTPTR